MTEIIEQIQEAVRQGSVRVRGGGSKSALSHGANLELSGASGVREYDPQEYTFTALAGTPLADVNALLAAEGQYLPFDPPFADAGATLGGTVAAGLSGPGRFRYGGVRDFVLGVTFVNGLGEVVRGGGRVVKNAAGFDFPKLMVGSLGRFGVMVELTFKVFPAPESYATLVLGTDDFGEAVTLMQKLAGSGFEAWGLELHPPDKLLARFGGLTEALPGQLARVQTFLGRAGEVVTGEPEAELWLELNRFAWLPDGHVLVKVVHSPGRVKELEQALTLYPLPHRYGVGGNVLYLAWPEAERTSLDALLQEQNLSGLALTGSWTEPQLGVRVGGAFLERVTQVFDPRGVFAYAKVGPKNEVTGAA